MNFKAHFTFGMFSGLAVYTWTNDVVAGLIMFFVQISLILDYRFKKVADFEPMHTVLAMILFWFASFMAFPSYHLYVLLSYFLHLFLDVFVDEKIPLLYPLKKQFMFPIKHSEDFIIWGSCMGMFVLVILW